MQPLKTWRSEGKVPDITKKYPSLSDVYRDLTLFFKIDGSLAFSLADFPSIAEGRWEYFRNNWDFIKASYSARIAALEDGPLKTNATLQYKDFGNLIDSQRASSQNPLSNRSTIRKFKDLLDIILINDLQVTQAEQALINTDVQRIANLQKDDFYEMRERVRITHDKTADSMGLSDETYNLLFDRVGGPQIITFRFDNYAVLSSLINLQNQITSMIPTTLVSNERPDPFETVRRALNNPEIPVQSLATGFIVPFPAGATLEQMAAQYLGNADRWLEIATANGLKFPYVDEIGRKVFLLINGIGNVVIIPLSEATNFFIGQELFVGSDGKAITKRNVVSIEEDKNNDQLLITVTGEGNMSDYVTVQRAFIFSYMPYTVNSDKFIMIPAPGSVAFPINAQEPWFVKNLSNDLKAVGVDLALGSNGDLVIDNTGDYKLVYGMANAAQALTLKVQTKARELLRDPSFGFQELAGKFKNSDINLSLLTLLIETALGGDDRFEGVDGLGFTISGTSVFVNSTIRLAGSSSSIPLTFELPKGP